MSRRRTPNAPPRISVGVALALAIVAGFVTWLAVRGGGTSSTSPAAPSGAAAASVKQIQNLAASLGQPVFWVGARKGFTYELTKLASGNIYVRYLPAGVKVGAGKPYLTVVTYAFPGAFAAIQKQAAARGAVSVKVAHGGIAVLDAAYPKSVHLAYPSVNYQVEVFDPTPAHAMEMVAAGQVGFFGSLKTAAPSVAATVGKALAASASDLKSVATSVGHPIYWAGPKPGYTYELTQTTTGNVFIRYLPPGVKVGTSVPYLTVASYPFKGASAALQRIANENKAGAIKLAGGGLAAVDRVYPKSVHLAFPGVDVEVEVFDPSAARARQVAASGEVSAIS